MSNHTPPTRDGHTPGTVATFADLILVALVTVSTVAFVLLTGRAGGPPLVRPLFGGLLVFVCPGYAITAALFPRKYLPVDGVETRLPVTVSRAERAVLAPGLSVVVVPSIGLAMTLLSIPISSDSLVLALGVVTLGSTLLAAWRRRSCRPAARFRIPLSRNIVDAEPHNASSLQLALSVTILFAVVGAGAAIITASPGEQYTEVAVLDDADNGTLSADEFPLTLSTNETRTVTLELVNNERQVMEYTVVVVRQTISGTGAIADTVERNRATVALGHGEQTRLEHVISPSNASERFRVAYLVYRDEPPENPTMDSAYRSVHVTVELQE
jgi:uncharacterized membrane protein